MSRIYILLPVHDRRAVTAGFVTCLEDQTDRDFHLLLLDDGSRDGTAAMVRQRLAPAVTVLRGDGRWFWAGALKAAQDWLRRRPPAPDDIVLIINDDARFDRDYLATGRRLVSRRPRTLIGSTGRAADGGATVDAGIRADLRHMNFAPATGSPPNCLSTRGLFLSARDYVRIGGFYPWLLPHYLSDYAFTIRAGHRGWRLTVAPELRLSLVCASTHWDPKGCRLPPVAFLRRFFSVKSVANPLHRSAFALLVCPWPWKLLQLPRIWAAALLSVAGHLAAAARRCGHRKSA